MSSPPTSQTVGTVSQVVFNPDLAALTGVVVGHLTVENTVASAVWYWMYNSALIGYAGETAGDRFARLCAENSVSCLIRGSSSGSTPMGVQEYGTLLSLLQSCERTDAGMLYESREFLGLIYCTGDSLCAQPTSITLSYSSADLSTFVPRGNDTFIANDVTATRVGGSSSRYVVTSGPLSNQEPPNGVGIYENPLSINPLNDFQLGDFASWGAHLGTVAEDRIELSVNLARTNFTNSATLTASVVGLDMGDVLAISSLPLIEYPDTINQTVLYCTEQLNTFVWTDTFVCGAKSPYNALVWGNSEARWSSEGSTLNGAHNSSTTTVSVATPGGVLWGHGSGDFDIIVSGERMTVTAVAGTTSPQNFTVIRSVNSVVKAHATGETVALFTPKYWSI
jgi:hypothetical protein